MLTENHEFDLPPTRFDPHSHGVSPPVINSHPAEDGMLVNGFSANGQRSLHSTNRAQRRRITLLNSVLRNAVSTETNLIQDFKAVVYVPPNYSRVFRETAQFREFVISVNFSESIFI